MTTIATRSNVASVIGSTVDSSSDSEETDDESDSSDGLEVIEEMSTGKARDARHEETSTNSNITVRSLLTVLKAPKQSDLTRKDKLRRTHLQENESVRTVRSTKGVLA